MHATACIGKIFFSLQTMTTLDSINRTPYQKGDAIDIYLTKPDPRNLPGFMRVIQEAFELDPDLKKSYKSPAGLYLTLMNRYGRFWMDPNGTLWYRDQKAQDHEVKKVSVSNGSIARVNCEIIPTIALAQLRQLLSTSDPKWSSLYDQISQHRSHIERSIEKVRPIT